MGEIKIYRCEDYELKRFGAKDSYEDYLRYFDTIFADYNPSGGTILQIRNEFPESELSFMEYVPVKGKDAGQLGSVQIGVLSSCRKSPSPRHESCPPESSMVHSPRLIVGA